MTRASFLAGVFLFLSLNAMGQVLQEPFPPAEELQQRRARIGLTAENEILICVAGGAEGEEVIRDYEYLTGLRSWGGILVLQQVDGEIESTLFLPAKDPDFERWNGPRAAPGEASRSLTGIDRILPLSDLAAWVLSRQEQIEVIHLVKPRAQEESRWSRLFAEGVEIRSAARLIHRHRQLKSDWEVDQLRRAIERTHEGLKAGSARATQAQHEHQIEAAIEGRFREQGSPAPGFPSIVGSGPQSCILHWQENNGELDRDGVLLMDVGARSGAYTADITRTVPVSGKWTERQRQIYEVVLEAQKAGIAAVRPGATQRDVDAAARKVIREAGFGNYFPHGTSHHVGMDVHDVGPRRALLPGMVITVEPGIYIAEENLGIRIEDMVRVTAEGAEVLSSAIPKSAEAMEDWVAARPVEKPVKKKPSGEIPKRRTPQRLR
jgi:Xaa-Pro aminopeptidase